MPEEKTESKAKEKTFTKETHPINILEIIKRDVLERLLDSYCFLFRKAIAVYYPIVYPATKDNLEFFRLTPAYGDTARLEPLNLSFCRKYRDLDYEYDVACRECDKKIVMNYYDEYWEGPKLFRCHLGLWEMIYPLYGGGRLLAVLYSGQIVVSKDVADWRDSLKQIALEIAWNPFDDTEKNKIFKKRDQIGNICAVIDNQKDISPGDKRRLNEWFKEAVRREIDANQVEEICDAIDDSEDIKDIQHKYKERLKEMLRNSVEREIPKKHDQVERIRTAIDKDKRILIKDKNKLQKWLTESIEDKGVDVNKLVGTYIEFKKFGKTMERVINDLDALQRRNLELDALVKAAHSVNSDITLSEVLEAIIKSGLDVMKHKGATISLYVLRHLSEDKEFIVAAGGGRGFEKRYIGKRFSDNRGLAGHVLQENERYHISHRVSDDPYYHHVIKTLRSVVVVPIRWGKQIVGILSMGSSHDFTFDENDAKLLEGFAEQVAIALRNAINNEKIKGQMHVQKKCMEAIIKGYDRTEICQSIIASASKTFNTKACSLFLHDGHGKLFLSATTDAILKKRMEEKSDVFYEIGEGLTGWVAKHRSVLRLKDITDKKYLSSISRDLNWENKFPEHLDQSAMVKSFIGAPIYFRNELLGVIRAAQKKDSWIFLPEDEEILQGIADQAAMALKFIDSLEQVTKAKEQLELAIRGFAHDAGRPAIGLYRDLNFLHDNTLDSEAKKSLFRMCCLSEHLAYLVDTYKDIGLGYEEQQIKIAEVEIVELSPMVDRIGVAVTEIFGEKKEKLAFVNQIGIDTQIKCDRGKMHAILYNLIVNAVKFCNTAVIVRFNENDEFWRVEVEDDGPGIKDSIIPTYKPTASQLGLYIVRKFVSAHNGKFQIVGMSNGGHGTLASVIVPKI